MSLRGFHAVRVWSGVLHRLGDPPAAASIGGVVVGAGVDESDPFHPCSEGRNLVENFQFFPDFSVHHRPAPWRYLSQQIG